MQSDTWDDLAFSRVLLSISALSLPWASRFFSCITSYPSPSGLGTRWMGCSLSSGPDSTACPVKPSAFFLRMGLSRCLAHFSAWVVAMAIATPSLLILVPTAKPMMWQVGATPSDVYQIIYRQINSTIILQRYLARHESGNNFRQQLKVLSALQCVLSKQKIMLSRRNTSDR